MQLVTFQFPLCISKEPVKKKKKAYSMKFDLPLLIQSPYIKGSTIYVIDNWFGAFSTALGKKQDR